MHDSPSQYGTDAVRWWLLRDVRRVGDADFTLDRLIARTNEEPANGLGNLVNWVVAMVHRYHDGIVPAAGQLPPSANGLQAALSDAPGIIDTA